MKQTIGFCQFTDAFHAFDRYNQFGYDALRDLFDYLEQYEDDTGEELELDVIGLCCDYTTNDWETVAQDYSIDLSDCEDDDEREDAVREYLEDNGALIASGSYGFLYSSF